MPIEPSWARSNWQSFAVRLTGSHEQRAVMQALLDRGVASRRGIMCAHREPPYQRRLPYALPESEQAQDRTLLLPLFPQLSEDDQNHVVSALRAALA
jgi:dTDP-4-amino-4,6-dideoxygalactose transaminase